MPIILILVRTAVVFPFRHWILPGGIFTYIGWYLAECVYDSAKGGTRAPDTLTPGLGDMWSRVSYLFAVYGLFFAPPVVYYAFTRQIDLILFGLVLWALVFFPMGLLAMVVLDSTTALNPFLLLGAILRTFGSYVGLLVVQLAITLATVLIVYTFIGYRLSLLGFVMVLAPHFYVAMIQAHLLGRFYLRYAEELDWGL